MDYDWLLLTSWCPRRRETTSGGNSGSNESKRGVGSVYVHNRMWSPDLFGPSAAAVADWHLQNRLSHSSMRECIFEVWIMRTAAQVVSRTGWSRLKWNRKDVAVRQTQWEVLNVWKHLEEWRKRKESFILWFSTLAKHRITYSITSSTLDNHLQGKKDSPHFRLQTVWNTRELFSSVWHRTLKHFVFLLAVITPVVCSGCRSSEQREQIMRHNQRARSR